MTPASYETIKTVLAKRGYAEEFQWAQNVKRCADAETFFQEACWVILNAGMKEQVARIIWQRIKTAWADGKSAGDVFGHKGKAKAIEHVRANRAKLFAAFKKASDKYLFLISIPWIGKITVYHLGKNLGLDWAKPDRHLVRISASYGEAPFQMCDRLSKATGDRIGAVDVVLWRAANLGLL